MIYFDSCGAMLRYAEENCAHSSDMNSQNSDFHGEHVSDIQRILNAGGDESMAAEAQALIDSVAVDIEINDRTMNPSPFGAYPVVPEVLSGHPTPMRRMTNNPNTASPVKIFASVSCWVGWKAHQIRLRGYSIAALCAYMSMIRPVELYTFTESGRGFQQSNDWHPIVTRIETAPVCLAEMAYAIASPGLYRRVRFSIAAKKFNFKGQFNPGLRNFQDGQKTAKDEHTYMEYLKPYLNATGNDIIIRGLLRRESIDPVEFIQSRLAQYMD